MLTRYPPYPPFRARTAVTGIRRTGFASRTVRTPLTLEDEGGEVAEMMKIIANDAIFMGYLPHVQSRIHAHRIWTQCIQPTITPPVTP